MYKITRKGAVTEGGQTKKSYKEQGHASQKRKLRGDGEGLSNAKEGEGMSESNRMITRINNALKN